MNASARMTAEANGWAVDVKGWRISQVCIDYAFTLVAWNWVDEEEVSVRFRIEGKFVVHEGDQEWEISPSESSAMSFAPALTVWNREIVLAHANSDGSLSIRLSDDVSLAVPIDPNYEAWEATGTGGLRLVSLPGGELAVWDAQPNADT